MPNNDKFRARLIKSTAQPIFPGSLSFQLEFFFQHTIIRLSCLYYQNKMCVFLNPVKTPSFKLAVSHS